MSDSTTSEQRRSGSAEDREVVRTGRATLRDVARYAGVTTSTVSRALDPEKRDLVNEVTRRRIERIAGDLDYRPHVVARNLRRGQTMTVGVVVPDLANPIFAPFARGIAHVLEAGGHLPLLADIEDDHERLLNITEQLVERRVAAIVVAAGRAIDAPALMRINRQGTPVIVAIRRPPGMHGVSTVQHDDRAGVDLAVRHLYDLGHRRIAQVRGPADIEPFPTRATAFTEAVRALGLTPAGESAPTARIALEDAREAALGLLDDDGDGRPTALFVPNDSMSLGVLDALHMRGLRCPQDISLVSYNDVFFAPYVNPPLTAVHLPAYELGRISGELALRLAAEPAEIHAVETSPPDLRVRGSTAPVTG